MGGGGGGWAATAELAPRQQSVIVQAERPQDPTSGTMYIAYLISPTGLYNQSDAISQPTCALVAIGLEDRLRGGEKKSELNIGL